MIYMFISDYFLCPTPAYASFWIDIGTRAMVKLYDVPLNGRVCCSIGLSYFYVRNIFLKFNLMRKHGMLKQEM